MLRRPNGERRGHIPKPRPQTRSITPPECRRKGQGEALRAARNDEKVNNDAGRGMGHCADGLDDVLDGGVYNCPGGLA